MEEGQKNYGGKGGGITFEVLKQVLMQLSRDAVSGP